MYNIIKSAITDDEKERILQELVAEQEIPEELTSPIQHDDLIKADIVSTIITELKRVYDTSSETLALSHWEEFKK